MIRRLHNSAIDKQKWDALVQCSRCADVYALSTFLTIVCPDWHGLILNDYEAVMPLPVKRKVCLKYLVQPMFSQQYSIYSQRSLLPNELNLFRTEILKFKSIRINLSMPLFGSEKQRWNYTLDLSKSYADLISAYSENARRNCKKAQENNLECVQTNSVDSVLQFFFTMDEQKNYTQHEKQISSLVNACEREVYEVRCGEEKYAVAIFLKKNSRLYYLFPASSVLGKKYSAMFLLIDTLIRKYAGSNMILDFEGSEIDGVRRFYEGFGAVGNPYYFFEKQILLL